MLNVRSMKMNNIKLNILNKEVINNKLLITPYYVEFGNLLEAR